MWVLVYIALFSEGMSIETWGKYNTQEACIAEVREAEIAVSFTNETMVCLELPPSAQIEYHPEGEKP